MFFNRMFFSIFLASHAVAIGRNLEKNQKQKEENTGPLRGGRFNRGKETIIAPEAAIPERENINHVGTLSIGSESIVEDDVPSDIFHDNSEVKHVIIACKDGEEELECKKRILDAIPKNEKDQFRINTYLKLPNAYAAEVRGDVSILDGLAGDISIDPPRETMHLKDSIQVHRNLQRQSTPYGVAMVKAIEVWKKYNYKGENVRICVMDTGVYRDHPDFDSKRMFGYNGNELVQPWWRDTDGHGTHVTGTIAASDNNQGVVGVAPGAEIFTARVFSTNGKFFSSNIISALQVCKDAGAQVISMSLGGPYPVSYEQRAYKDLFEKFGIVTVAASGNTGGTNYLYPASYDNVISVASVDGNGVRSSFSTKNNKVDVAAPGSSIISTWENGSYATVSGTSMACPHVSGVVALMLNANPSATPAQISTALQNTSKNPKTTGKDNDLGYGVVNALAAVDEISKLKGNTNPKPAPNEDAVNNSNTNVNNGNSGNRENSRCVELVITLRTDRFASDISHWLQEGSKYIFYDNTFASFSTYRERACIDPTKCSTYNIRDAFGDGISGEGVEIKYGGEVVYQGGDFGIGGVKYLGACSGQRK